MLMTHPFVLSVTCLNMWLAASFTLILFTPIVPWPKNSSDENTHTYTHAHTHTRTHTHTHTLAHTHTHTHSFIYQRKLTMGKI